MSSWRKWLRAGSGSHCVHTTENEKTPLQLTVLTCFGNICTVFFRTVILLEQTSFTHKAHILSSMTWEASTLDSKTHLPSLVLGSLISESVWPGCQLPRQCYPQCWHLVFRQPSSTQISWHTRRSSLWCLCASFYKLTAAGRSEQREGCESKASLTHYLST